jgi:hypothetical protein
MIWLQPIYKVTEAGKLQSSKRGQTADSAYALHTLDR